MGLFVPKCSICEQALLEADECLEFEHFLGPKHALLNFSGSAMHKSCFKGWSHREEFLALHRLAMDLFERVPRDLPASEHQSWFLREAERLGLGY